MLHAHGGLAGVVEAGLQAYARIVRGRTRHARRQRSRWRWRERIGRLGCGLAAWRGRLRLQCARRNGQEGQCKQSQRRNEWREHGNGSLFLLQHVLHNSDLGSLGVIRIGGEVEEVGVLTGAWVIE